MVWHWDNVSAFGANSATENGLTNYNLRFSGQYFDKESNLHYNNNRTYNPFLGRYMQSDPIGLAGDVNTFRYAGNNGLSNFDSSGLQVVGIGIEVPNQEGTILDLDNDPGHAFTYLLDENNNIVAVNSFGPTTSVGVTTAKQFLHEGLKSTNRYIITDPNIKTWGWKLNANEYAKCQGVFNKYNSQWKPYTPTNECSTNAVSILRECGIPVPNGVGSVTEYFVHGNIVNPLALSSQLNQAGYRSDNEFIAPYNKFIADDKNYIK